MSPRFWSFYLHKTRENKCNLRLALANEEKRAWNKGKHHSEGERACFEVLGIWPFLVILYEVTTLDDRERFRVLRFDGCGFPCRNKTTH